MIIDKEVIVKPNNHSIKHYIDKGYDAKCKQELLVKVEDLLPNSKVNILAKCDYCENIVKILYKNYFHNYNSGFNKFSCCTKCTVNKNVKKCQEKYGTDYANQSIIIKNKTKENSLKNIKIYDNSTLLENKPDYLKYILTEYVTLTINHWNINHFIKLGYNNLKMNQKWKVPVEHLMSNGSSKVKCKCKFCDHIQETTFQKFMTNYNRGNYYSCVSCNNETYKISMLEKYNVDNSYFVKKFDDAKKKTCLERYGNEYEIASDSIIKKTKKVLFEKYGGHQMMNADIKNTIITKGLITKIERGLIIPDCKLSEWLLYRRNVRKLTERNRNLLLKEWNGFDFYDDEYIKDNFKFKHTDRLYPTLDHKISIYNGFINNISVENISDISNLCITKKYINSMKSKLTIYEYNKKRELM